MRTLTRTKIFISILTVAALLCCSCKKEKEATLPQVQLNQLKAECENLNRDGIKFRENGDFDNSIDKHLNALFIAERIKDTVKIAQSLNFVGTSFRRKNDIAESSSWHFEALDIILEFSDSLSFDSKRAKATSLNGLGNIFQTLGNYDEALDFFHLAIKEEEILGNPEGQAKNAANIATALENQGKIEEASQWYKESMELNRKANSMLGVGLCHNSFGRLAMKAGNMTQAEKDFNNAYTILKGVDHYYWLDPCLSLAELYIRIGNLPQAYQLLNEGLKVASDIKSEAHIIKAYLLYSEYYESQSDWKNALKFHKMSESTLNASYDLQGEVEVQKLRTKHEQMMRARETSRYKREQIEQEQKTRLAIVIALIIAFFSLAITMNLIFGLRMRKKANDAMNKMYKTRQAFFTNVTHELRTPLTVILGTIQKLKEEYAKDDKGSADFDVIIRQGNALLELVNQLLDVTKIKSAIGDAHWKHGNIDILLQMEVDSLRMMGNQSLIDLQYATKVPELEMDFVPNYIKKIVDNLITNAIKFTPRGGQVIVTLDKDKDMAKISVVDNGQGIKSEDLPHIFDAFFQGDNPGRIEGSGIGLAMTKEMVEAMDGHIEVFSLPGEGTSFVVYIPLAHGNGTLSVWNPDEINNKPGETQKNITHQDGATILLVEDNEDVAKYEGGIINQKYNVIYARNGQEGLDKAKEYVPDLIITDLMMPIMDGYELCQKVRESIEISHIPIIVISALNSEEERVEALHLGADSYISKPFNKEELMAIINNALSRRELIREAYGKALHEGKEDQVENLPEKDMTFLTNLNGAIYSQMEDPDFSSEMLAEIMCLSQRQLSRKVKAVTGFDTTTYIRKARMASARRLLLTTDIPIGEIVGKCGFDSASYFSKLYKREYGETPSSTRKGDS